MEKALCALILILLAAPNSSTQQTDFFKLRGPYLGQTPPGRTPEIFADQIITPHCSLHSSPVFTPDLKEMYWAPMNSGSCEDKTDEILFMQIVDNVWTNPEVVPFSSSLWDSDDPSLSPDGLRLYFTTRRPSGFLAFNFSEKIMYVERKGLGWSSARSVGKKINSMFRHWQFSVSKNYNLYFRADKRNVEEPGIYVSKYIDGTYQEPERLPQQINSINSTLYDPYSPYIAADESYIIFARTLADRGDDLFISFKDSNGRWTEAMNLGIEINSHAHEFCPNVTPDGKYLFFISQRDGENKAYWVSTQIIDALRPSE